MKEKIWKASLCHQPLHGDGITQFRQANKKRSQLTLVLTLHCHKKRIKKNYLLKNMKNILSICEELDEI